MSGIFASCALTALLLAAAWADHHQHDHDGEMSCHKLSSPNADFAFALYKSLNAKAAAGKNIFYSPLGISTALSMLSTGASGETHSQLFSSLGYSAHNQAQINEAYKHLFHMHGHSQENQQLDVGNGVALRSGFNPVEKFLNDVRHYYSGEIFNVDFTKPAEAAAEINSFIANKTQNKLKDMVKDLDHEMAMVLINYVYFRGQWEKPFNGNLTNKADFHVDDTTTVQVNMMRRTGRFYFYQDVVNHTTVIMLPYKGQTSMMIVLPDEGQMAEVEGYINKDYLRHWQNSVLRRSVALFLPKFSISTEATLDSTLKELGITNAFADNADFSGISEEVKLKVSKVSHQAVLSVDETGTEAAAATTIEVMPMSMPRTMKLNRPFLVFILEHSLSPRQLLTFAFALYTKVWKCGKTCALENILLNSPLGIPACPALSMLSTGARGETHSQLFSSLGYSNTNQSQVNDAYKHLFDMHGHSQENQQLDVGNGVALRSGFNPVEKFLNDVRHYYSGEIFNVDFTKPAEAAAEINSFIANKTQDKIKDMVKDLDPEMAMLLINYVNFRGQWKSPFSLDMTNKADFHVDKTTKVQVDMMMRTGYYSFYEDSDNHTTAIMLPYNGSTSMMIVLPDEGRMAEVEGYINKDYLRHWQNSVRMSYVDLFLPKFSISTEASLDSMLKELGITNAFADNADFSGISEEVKLKVSKASHKAVLNITEMGTEAAATSIIEVIFLMMPPSIRIDRPFLVFIMENSTGSILFMGKINNPTAM
ncbi:LOW QUALITY PROTEIN: alpha-1-antitrypsin-like [Morone saxatilis]|uniref:LOW QUALITY PROTEIN: alpha-1-antitrypsin-like n=1 Tax=Morone saxatilis TaxID=34816 RepID=UPI0015E20182|nr:LOW QUALITY PROTEIN: alpha-1-antitrypsin-like [Morone saxatilis]